MAIASAVTNGVLQIEEHLRVLAFSCVVHQDYALLEGRAFVIPDDVKALAVHVLSHRIVERASFDRRGGKGGQDFIRKILGKVAVNA